MALQGLLVAGVDASYERHGTIIYAAVTVVRLPEFQLVDQAVAVGRSEFPYIPGLLSFRELPTVMEAFRQLRTVPQVVVCDGQGIAHPRRMGIASHLGLWLDLPTVGCGKTRLWGHHGSPHPERGGRVPLRHAGQEIGAVVTTRPGVAPVYVSPGHRLDVAGAVDLVLACCGRYRLPEPIRAAHSLGNAVRRRGQAEQPLLSLD